MPVSRGVDENGSYFKWKPKGKRVYFDPDDTADMRRARKVAMGQGRAITENVKKKRRRNDG